MFKLKFFNKKSISFSWFVSYVLIIVISLFISMYTHHIAKEKVLSQINAINQESLNRNRDRIDNMQKNIADMSTELSREDTLRTLMKQNTVDSGFLYDVISLKEKINLWENLESDVERVYVYFKNTDFIVDRSKAQPLDFYYGLHYNNKSVTKDDFRNFLTNGKSGDCITVTDSDGKKNAANVLFVFPVYSEDLFSPEATIVAELRKDVVISTKKDESYLGDICILDGENTVLLSDMDNEEYLQKNIINKLNLTLKKDIYISENEAVLYTHSKQNDWKYLTVIEKSEYLKELSHIRIFTYVLIAIFLVIGVAFAAYMSIKNRRPILQIVEQLSNHKKELSQRAGGNELQYINHCIVDLLEKREEQNNKFALQRPIIKDAVINELLQNDNVSELSLKELLSSVDISLWEKYFAIVTFHIDDSELFFEENYEDKNNKKLSHLIISNILEEMLDSDIALVCCNVKDTFLCIMNSNRQDMSADIRGSLRETMDFVKTNFNLRLIAGMSTVHEDYYGLRICYNEAQECMEYKFLVDYDIIEYSLIKENVPGIYYFPIEKEIQMITALKSGDFEAGLKILNHIFDENIEKCEPQIHMVKCLLYDILGCVMKVLNDLGETDGENVFEHFKVFERIDNSTSVEKTKTAFMDLFKEICEKAISKSIENNGNNIDTIKEFIDSNYHDPNLSGSMVAQHFGINQSYLSVLFKKYTGEGLLEYTMKIRMKKALGLLADTDETIESIAEKVGYMSVKTFRRTFKKIYGFTPSMYRDTLTKDR